MVISVTCYLLLLQQITGAFFMLLLLTVSVHAFLHSLEIMNLMSMYLKERMQLGLL